VLGGIRNFCYLPACCLLAAGTNRWEMPSAMRRGRMIRATLCGLDTAEVRQQKLFCTCAVSSLNLPANMKYPSFPLTPAVPAANTQPQFRYETERSAFLPLITLSNLTRELTTAISPWFVYELWFRTSFSIIAQLIVGDERLWRRISIGVLGFENRSLTVFLCPRFYSYAFKRDAISFSSDISNTSKSKRSATTFQSSHRLQSYIYYPSPLISKAFNLAIFLPYAPLHNFRNHPPSSSH